MMMIKRAPANCKTLWYYISYISHLAEQKCQHFVYIFTKWVILLLRHVIDMIFFENMNIINISSKNWSPQYNSFCGCLLSYFVQIYKKHFYNYYMNVQLFLYTLKIYLLSICIFHFPKQNRYKNLKAWRSLIQYYLWGPLWIFFDLRNESGYKNNILIQLTCFSISRTKYNRWSKRSVTLRTVLLFGVLLC